MESNVTPIQKMITQRIPMTGILQKGGRKHQQVKKLEGVIVNGMGLMVNGDVGIKTAAEEARSEAPIGMTGGVQVIILNHSKL